jgi:hypothetical protein
MAERFADWDTGGWPKNVGRLPQYRAAGERRRVAAVT